MSLKIADFLFYGPFQVATIKVRANQTPVIFAIVCRAGDPWNPTFRLIDIGASPAEGLVLAEQPQRTFWDQENDGELEAYLYDTPASAGFNAEKRTQIVDDIRAQIGPPRGTIPISGG
ncbi:hypothetical protein [Bradyrhizobium sp. WD16]|uniref:hypothetical protein n=1 Tax=Bradyrhizobium sp. WD16 TaxID=1521768 RepID=UPI0020A2A3A0|nr:hypothetical protein [Bradyrhizobium sp. WD16]UTD29100.1 hypothetical protein DB459_21540 [Bradyrhizobium sp. WD16]